MFGVEVAGAYLSNGTGSNANISKVYIDEYEGNTYKDCSSTFYLLSTDKSLTGMNPITHFHTHLSNIGMCNI